MTMVPQETLLNASSEANGSGIKGGPFEDVDDKANPFSFMNDEGAEIDLDDRIKWDKVFKSLGPTDGKVSGDGQFFYSHSTKTNLHVTLLFSG